MDRKIENRVGIRYALFALIAMPGQIVIALIMKKVCPEFLTDNLANISLILPIVLLDIIGFPLLLLLLKKLPKGETEKEKLGAGGFLQCLFVCYFLALIGMLIGTVVSFAIGASEVNIADVIVGSSVLPRVLYVGILAPIFEELIFRKLLIDHLLPRGKFFAIFVSALSFGLFHGNFNQFFFATFLGLVFGYVYVKTGKIYYSMGFHFIINMTTTAVVTLITSKYDLNSSEGIMFLGLYVMYFLVMAVAGAVVFFARIKKITLVEESEEVTRGGSFKAAFTSPGLWAFYAVCIFMFVYQILAVKVG